MESWKRKQKTQKQLPGPGWQLSWLIFASLGRSPHNLIREYFAPRGFCHWQSSGGISRAGTLCSSFIPGLIPAGSFWGTFWWWSGESSPAITQTASPPCHTLGLFIFIRTFIAALSPQSISRQHSTLDRERRHFVSGFKRKLLMQFIQWDAIFCFPKMTDWIWCIKSHDTCEKWQGSVLKCSANLQL